MHISIFIKKTACQIKENYPTGSFYMEAIRFKIIFYYETESIMNSLCYAIHFESGMSLFINSGAIEQINSMASVKLKFDIQNI